MLPSSLSAAIACARPYCAMSPVMAMRVYPPSVGVPAIDAPHVTTEPSAARAAYTSVPE